MTNDNISIKLLKHAIESGKKKIKWYENKIEDYPGSKEMFEKSIESVKLKLKDLRLGVEVLLKSKRGNDMWEKEEIKEEFTRRTAVVN